MLNLKRVEIGKKIGILSICALFGMLIIILAAMAFLPKIQQVSELTTAAKDYEIIFHKTTSAFQQYALTKKVDDHSEFIKNIEALAHTNGVIPALADLFQRYGNEKDVFKAYVEKYQDGVGLRESIGLVGALQGKPILAKMVTNCKEANKVSKQWLELSRNYSEADYVEKASIQKQVTSIRQQLATLLQEFQRIMVTIKKGLISTIMKLFIAIAVFTMIVLSIVSFMVSKSIVKPLKATVAFAKAIARGDLTQKLEISNRDELGDMGESLNQMSRELGQMLGEIKMGTQTLSTASTELSAISEQLNQDTRDTSGKAAEVAAATDNMSENMHEVAKAMTEATDNSGIVAAAAEEMSSTIDEIAQNAEKAKGVSEDANGKTNEAKVRINELGQAAEGIGKVVETITDISEQVNLLALNATIEAARAGEAGKGFAVVANEIKELARQTAEATQDIKQKIQSIQSTTSTTIARTEEVTVVIGQVNDVISGIAAAVEEQSTATREIVANIHKTSNGIQEVSGHVTNTSLRAKEINSAISEVNQSSAQMAESSSQVNHSSIDLATLAEKLTSLVARFQI